MRKDSKNIQNVQVERVQGYHEGERYDREAYAFEGFVRNYYLNSDRKIPLDDNYCRVDGQALQGFGLEIETECNGISKVSVLAEVLRKVIFPNFKFGDCQFKLQRDGSLGGETSVEIISQIMTKSRIRNDYAAYKTMFDVYFPACGISADSYNTNCGMHVNVSNAVFGKTIDQQIDAIRKLYYIVNKHYDVCCRLFYRNPRETTYCGRMSYANARELNIYNASASHYNCMNLSHFMAGRIEIRLVGGQRDYYCFRNTMESVFFLCDRVRSLKWEELDDITTIFRGCNQYVMKRLPDCGLDTDTLDAIRATVKPEDLELAR